MWAPIRSTGDSRTEWDSHHHFQIRWRRIYYEGVREPEKVIRKSCDWVHQGINSHNFVFLHVNERQVEFTFPILQRFQYSRPKLAPSINQAVDDIAFAVYRHPSRQGTGRQGHTKMHDLYSLGVVLLEIGLWQSALDIVQVNEKEFRSIKAEKMKSRLLAASTTRLNHCAGAAYQQAAHACLSSDSGVAVDDSDKSQLANAVQRLVIQRLSIGIKPRC